MSDHNISKPRRLACALTEADELLLHQALSRYVRLPVQHMILAALRQSLPGFIDNPGSIQDHLSRPVILVSEIGGGK